MSSLLAHEEDEDKEPEITLSTTSLLGLFLGLVLVCGVFFGFGYSVGRRSSAGAAMSPANNTEEPDTSERQPAAAESMPAEPQSAASPQPAVVAEDAPGDNSPSHPAPVTLPIVETAPAPQLQTETPTVAKQEKSLNEARPEAGHAMVQVAAVLRQEDADVLVSALRQRGFSAVIRREPEDNLLHVQVGPFNSRVEANATRQKLLSDGYNAIIKQ